MESCVPPGFRFHPTEEELVGYYLKRKIHSLKIDLDVIVDIDLYNMEPWDIQARCKLGYDEQNEWYFFSHKDRKYPTGTRTNRATAAGFWKATGRDKAVLSKNRLIGMRKTLVFYKGRAPNGRKTDWIMHEYRLQTSEHEPTQARGRDGWYAGHSRNQALIKDQVLKLGIMIVPSKVSTSFATKEGNLHHQTSEDYDEERSNHSSQYIDWKSLDILLASQVNDSSAPSFPLQNFAFYAAKL
ncbi:hypothetical protein OIU77_004664 [Salix suchowensis]|uniref:NAC domain-containing protein n=1 Tax=Salix suchowensis TaxID=1278906 RepID=A0ABQ9AV83_9ROSI|nr:hypothetical protein OIU77_004664 [Salix suchowensis]